MEQTTVTLSSEEQSLYNSILKKCARDMDEVISSQVKIKRYSVLFTAITKLRRVCNHGAFPVGNKDAISTLVAVPDADAEQDCEICGGASEDNLELVSMGDLCPRCGRSISEIPHCLDSAISEPGGVGAVRLLMVSPETWQPQPGLSTKLQAVVDNLEKINDDSKRYVDFKPPSLSELCYQHNPVSFFSYWTATLDMLEWHLRKTKTSYLRIDGNVPYRDRLHILESFKHSKVPILLMSIQTGAVG